MAEETLVESLVTDSIKLVDALDRQGDNMTNAVWYYYPDVDEWRFLLAGDAFDRLLPKDEGQAYRKIANAIGQANVNSLTIADVKPMRSDDKVLEATKFLVKTPPNGVVRIHFRDSTVNGIFVKEMLVLRAA